LNGEVWLVEDRLAPERDAGFLRKYVEKALQRSFETRFLIPFQRDPKISINKEFAFALHNVSGQRHNRQRTLLLCGKIAADDKCAEANQKAFYETCLTSICQDSVSRKAK